MSAPDPEENAVGASVRALQASMTGFINFFTTSPYAAHGADPQSCDFCFGNPNEMPVPQIADALVRWAVPHNQRWFAYKTSEPDTVAAVVASLSESHGMDFEPEDIAMTTGAFGAIAAALRAVVDPGDEVIYLSPPWFFYEPMILTMGAVPVRVDLPAPAFALPLDAIEAAVSGRTRAIIVNSPHNPSGRILQPDELAALGALLDRSSERNGRPIYLLSDEAYRRILFDGATFHSPARHYARTFVLYTYGKSLLAPGQRLGYLAMPPTMPNREALRLALLAAQVAGGFLFPNALMQYALADLEKACVDIGVLQRRRDRVLAALAGAGYETICPAGTFYVLVRSPVPDDVAFAQRLAEDLVFVLPGAVFELPGWFRISLTANDAMVDRALPVFDAAIREVTTP